MTFFRVRYSSGRTETLDEAAFERARTRKAPKIIWHMKALIHRCQACGAQGPWTDQWIAWRRFNDRYKVRGEGTDIYCSEACCKAENPDWRPPQWLDISEEPLPLELRRAMWDAKRAEDDRRSEGKQYRRFPFPEWKGQGYCKWCNEPMGPGRAIWWHPACKKEMLLHVDTTAQFNFLVRRDGAQCWDCKTGWRWERGFEDVLRYTWQAVPLCLHVPPSGSSWDNRLDRAGEEMEGVVVGSYCRLAQVSVCGPLEVDHDIPLWAVRHLPPEQRRPYYGPRNLRLRGQPCHKAKTALEAAQRAAWRPPAPPA